MPDNLASSNPRRVSRRSLLRAAASAALGASAIGMPRAFGVPMVLTVGNKLPPARPRPDLVDKESVPGIEVIQLTTETGVGSSHLYMEAQVFAPDSKRFLLHRAATAHGGSRSDPEHQYLRCDVDDDCSLHPITEETGAIAPSVSPDGKYVYYFVDETRPGGGRFSLKRVNLDGTDRQTLLVVDGPLPDTNFRASKLYVLSTISSDGKRLAVSAFLGDGNTPNAPFGLLVFDLVRPSVRLVLHGPTWCNVHGQYCRSLDAEASHDILVQENHECEIDERGGIKKLVGGQGADIHVIRDDGTQFRNMPWGRDGNEFCQGHQCWRGQTTWAITSTGTRKPPEAQLIEGRAAPHAGHVGIATPGGVRNDLSRSFTNPKFYHFATDLAGKRLVSDAGPLGVEAKIFTAEFGEPGKDPLAAWRYLLSPRSTCKKESHIHPFLSPDGKLAFFNSDETGRLQAYMVRGL